MGDSAAKTLTEQSTGGLPDDVILRVVGLRKFFPIRDGGAGSGGTVRAVDDVHFELRASETLSLVGESGCGKSTTARCVVRATAPTHGAVLFRTESGQILDLASLSPKKLRPLRRELQMVFQDPYSALNPRLTVRDIVAEPLIIHGQRDKKIIDERVCQLLEQVGLRRDHLSRFPHAFSGGQRQRISIARALALQPRLIVLDEAVSALDVSVQAQILNLLLDLQAAHKLSYLFVSHDLSVVRSISDRVGVMYVGQMVELADCDALFERPLHPYSSALLAAAPKLTLRTRKSSGALPGEAASARSPPTGCYFHPRCAFALPRCLSEAPPWSEVQPKRFVRCHRAHELVLTGVEP